MKYITSYKFKEIIKLSIFFITLILLLVLSRNNYEAVSSSVTLFITSVFPSLFPFIFFTEFILNTNIVNTIAKCFGGFISKVFKVSKSSAPAVIIGFLCGYPMGAKAVATLYEKSIITKKDADKLILFVNNCNPAFILSTVAIGIFYNLSIGVLLLISHYLSAIIIGITVGRLSNKYIIHEKGCILNSFKEKTEKKQTRVSKFELIRKSILNSLVTMGSILGFIVIFNLMFSILNNLTLTINLDQNIMAFISGIFEITAGCNNIYALNLDLIIKICIISFLLGFSGMCILCQIYSSISKYNFSFKKIILSKLIQGILSFIITYILLSFTNICDIDSLTVFNSTQGLASVEYINKMKISYLISTFVIILLITIYALYLRYKNMNKIQNKK